MTGAGGRQLASKLHSSKGFAAGRLAGRIARQQCVVRIVPSRQLRPGACLGSPVRGCKLKQVIEATVPSLSVIKVVPSTIG